MTALALAIAKNQVDGLAARYLDAGRLRIEGALTRASADALHGYLANDAEWWRILNAGAKTWDLGPESIAALTGEKERALHELVHAQARDGFQYLYDSVRVPDDPAERKQRGLPIDRLIGLFNQPEALALFRRIVGDETIAMVDGQATRYLPGHFLTAHDDEVAGKDRVAAYVLSLTPKWRTEWGGLLQFHDGSGDVTAALAPRFNAMHLFRVPQLHSVTYVTPFAGAARYSVTGWLRR